MLAGRFCVTKQVPALGYNTSFKLPQEIFLFKFSCQSEGRIRVACEVNYW